MARISFSDNGNDAGAPSRSWVSIVNVSGSAEGQKMKQSMCIYGMHLVESTYFYLCPKISEDRKS